jgi:D-arabinose 5-phosphate isomerase GutQ
VYAKNETQVKNTLRKYFRDLGQIINIRRLFATDVIDFYTKKRSNAVKRIADVVLEATMNPQEDPQSIKKTQTQKAQVAKQDAAKRIALAKQNMQKQLQQKKIEMQKSLANQQMTLQQKAKTGSLENTQG